MTTLSAEAPPAANVDAAPLAAAPRVESVDVLRGIVMVIMALDHVRDFVGPGVPGHGIDVEKLGAPLFLTRWITHFCAPVFVLLAGTGAYLQSARGKGRGELSRFLLTRGLWLVLLELTVVRFGWTFDPGYHMTPLQVIWAIGWSMVVLAGLVHLPVRAVGAIGIAIIALHNLLDGVTPERFGALAPLWSILHVPSPLGLGPGRMAWVAYPLVPWIGVMAAGYALGAFLGADPAERKKRLFALGGALTLAFIALRAVNLYGDPEPWSHQSSALYTALSFLSCTKYPPSLLYLLMTIGPALVALGALEGRDFPGKRTMLLFGRVPLFYYLLHLPFAHAMGSLLYLAWYGPGALSWDTGPAANPPAPFGLPVVYAVTLLLVLLLYPLCRWFGDLKRRRRDLGWLSYL
ncbi:DUF1624 domain-containing protein [Polyangium aurulentum]|uniref:DUF1624 domain-containing protein n=1 Tax=Polyangium aurulentum TaxID=2567896 RepID=UPI0010ADD6B6|nr:heparan-alpha-glucosaminide N-acetyltransferase domain-containing protein [Polyangium aurulentum]UQA55281.1 DUF1624 domain-containing protein [Polyangium aurulentum]